jgi:hypothetical protein
MSSRFIAELGDHYVGEAAAQRIDLLPGGNKGTWWDIKIEHWNFAVGLGHLALMDVLIEVSPDLS